MRMTGRSIGRRRANALARVDCPTILSYTYRHRQFRRYDGHDYSTEGKRSRWSGRTSNPEWAVYVPVWVRLPLLSATPLIVATAGHVDHGKTTLVKALTGINTSRLPEERARGITIDIGFAHWETADGSMVGFVDVPGHERFVHNMLAGVCGADFALLVVAADDGVMPQTIEHLQIVDLLGIARGIAVITKTDRVSAARVAEVEAGIRTLLQTTRLAAGSPLTILPVVATEGIGIDALRAALAAHARDQQASAAKRRFRYAIDRVFTTAGSGTVVTGTVFDGAVEPGARMLLSPVGVEVRIRAIQKYGRKDSRAIAGERCALNLSGVEVADVRRGQWVVDPALDVSTTRLDVRLSVLATEPHALRHWTPCHLHIGTEDVTARVALRRGAAIAPGEMGYAQLIADRPLSALHGDRFVIRDQSATRTIGGGIVVDPFPPARRIRPELRIAQLDALDTDDAGAALAALARQMPSGVDLGWFGRTFDLDDAQIAALVAANALVVLGRDTLVALPAADVEAIAAKVVDTLRRFHVESPQAFGMEVAALRAQCAPGLAPSHFQSLLRRLVDEQKLSVSGALAKIRKHVATDNPEDRALWSAMSPALEAAGLNGLTVSELAAAGGVSTAAATGFLQRASRLGDVVRVAENRYYLRGTMARFAALAADAARASADGTFTAATFRDRTGIGRGRAIEVLESLDRLHVTQRIGDVRMLRRAPAAALTEVDLLPMPSGPRGR